MKKKGNRSTSNAAISSNNCRILQNRVSMESLGLILSIKQGPNKGVPKKSQKLGTGRFFRDKNWELGVFFELKTGYFLQQFLQLFSLICDVFCV